ncbi:MAG: DUF2520 domain-containing protein [Bacteroidetes bacterium]|nr:DUF2520 domain-containing protein [Bacteroidota bacterium]
MQKQQHIVVIGAGRLASHVLEALTPHKNIALTLFNHRRSKKAVALSRQYACGFTASYAEIPADADYYLVCVKDTAIAEVARALKPKQLKGCVLHTSGTAELALLKGVSPLTGVFYPLQTFSEGDHVQWNEIPVLAEAASLKTLQAIWKFANLLGAKITPCKPGERLKMHAAAVIANNFSNAMYALAFDFVSDELSVKHTKLLLPLIRQTARKIEHLPPHKAQTGPAVRGDQETIKKHLLLLKKYPQTKKVYELITRVIMARK